MGELCRYADSLKTGLDSLLIGISDGKISFSDQNSYIPDFKGGKVAMASELAKLEEEFHSYPSLIYDGPFSERER